MPMTGKIQRIETSPFDLSEDHRSQSGGTKAPDPERGLNAPADDFLTGIIRPLGRCLRLARIAQNTFGHSVQTNQAAIVVAGDRAGCQTRVQVAKSPGSARSEKFALNSGTSSSQPAV